MARKTACGIHIRLSRNDYDLLLLASQCNMAKVVRDAIRNYLSGKREAVVPIPSYMPMSQTYKAINIRLDDEKDIDIIEFVESIPKGNKNAIYKLLIRHAMEVPDIRQWLKDPDAAKKPKAEPKSTKKAAAQNKAQDETETAPAQPVRKPETRPIPPTSTSASADEDDDIFRLI